MYTAGFIQYRHADTHKKQEQSTFVTIFFAVVPPLLVTRAVRRSSQEGRRMGASAHLQIVTVPFSLKKPIADGIKKSYICWCHLQGAKTTTFRGAIRATVEKHWVTHEPIFMGHDSRVKIPRFQMAEMHVKWLVCFGIIIKIYNVTSN